MKNFFTLIVISLFGIQTYGQVMLLDEDFNSTVSGAIPLSFTQWGDNSDCLVWETTGDGSVNVNDKLVTIDYFLNQCLTPNSSAWLQTPYVDLTQVSNPVLEFSCGIQWSHDIAFTLHYNIEGTANWIPITSYGADAPAVNIIMNHVSFGPMISDTIVYDLNTFASETNIRFSFGYTNAIQQTGHDAPVIAIDDIKIYGNNSSSIFNQESTTGEEVLEIFPNPVNDLITISFITDLNQNQTNIYHVKDISGKLVKIVSAKQKSHTLDVSDLSSGFYVLEYQNGNSVYTKKFVKE